METRQAKNGWMIGIVVGAFLLLIVVGLAMSGDNASIKRAVKEGITADLVYNAEESKFSDMKIEIWGDDKEYADVDGVVEAYNGFGTKIKTGFTAELSKENGAWVLDDYSIFSGYDELDDALEELEELLE